MKKTASLEDAVALAAIAHKGQTDKAGAPYMLHPLRVMMRMKTETAQIVAVLHDIIEDCIDKGYDFDYLKNEGFSKEVIDALKCLTTHKSESYDDFIHRVQTNPTAIEVKIADIEDNMNLLRIKNPQPRDFERLEKYHRAWRTLTQFEKF